MFYSDCRVNTDLAFVLDSSGSIGWRDWELVRHYVSNVTSTLIGSEDNYRIAIIRYSSRVFLDLNFNSSQSELNNIIDEMRFLGLGTNTAGAIRQLIPLPWRENVLRIAIVMTDGRSNDPDDTLIALEELHRVVQMPSLTIFVIGVTGDVNLQEVLAIASSNFTFSPLDNFQNTAAFTQIREQQSYHICHTGNSIYITMHCYPSMFFSTIGCMQCSYI